MKILTIGLEGYLTIFLKFEFLFKFRTLMRTFMNISPNFFFGLSIIRVIGELSRRSVAGQ